MEILRSVESEASSERSSFYLRAPDATAWAAAVAAMGRSVVETTVAVLVVSVLRLGQPVPAGDVARILAVAAVLRGLFVLSSGMVSRSRAERRPPVLRFGPAIAAASVVLAAMASSAYAQAAGLPTAVGFGAALYLGGVAGVVATVLFVVARFLPADWRQWRYDWDDPRVLTVPTTDFTGLLTDRILGQLPGTAVRRDEVQDALARAGTEPTDATVGYRDRYLGARQAIAVELGLGPFHVPADPLLPVLGPAVFGVLVIAQGGSVLDSGRPWVAPAVTAAVAGLAWWVAVLSAWRRAPGSEEADSVRWPGRVHVAALAGFLAAVAAAAALGSGHPRPALLGLAALSLVGLIGGAAVVWRRSIRAARWKVLETDDPAVWRAAGWSGVRDRTLRIAERARAEWLDALARAGTRSLSSWLTQVTAPRFDLDVPLIKVEELGDIGEAGQLVPTASTEHVGRLLATMRKAAIGISGRRGAGKTSLLRSLGDDRIAASGPGIRLLVSAPTEYDRREFLIHLFIEFCERVSPDLAAGTDPGVRAAKARTVRNLFLLVAGALLVAAGALVLDRDPAVLAALVADPWKLIGAIAVLVASGATVTILRQLADRVDPRDRVGVPVAELARRFHAQLRYLETHTLTHTAAVKSSIGLEMGGSRSRQRSALALSYPQLVDEFRWFLDQVGLQARAADQAAKIVICIDELDKIADGQAAEAFINDIKAIFGVDGCYFFVAVSEDALVGFQQRTMSVRGTFDSAFDTIIGVGPFDLGHTRELLVSRLGRLPEPVIWLCHCLSGGLPRDVNRAGRAIFDLGLGAVNTVPALTRALVSQELAAVWSVAGDEYRQWGKTVCDALADNVAKTIEIMHSWYDGPRLRSGSPIDRLARVRWRLADPDSASAELAEIRSVLELPRAAPIPQPRPSVTDYLGSVSGG